MTSCALLGMNNTMWNAERQPMHREREEFIPKKQKKLLKAINDQLTSVKRILMFMIVIEVIRMMQSK